MIEIVVDLPAPFGPRKAKNEPSGTSGEERALGDVERYPLHGFEVAVGFAEVADRDGVHWNRNASII